MKKCCIIGAGASGLAAMKVLKENGISFDCFEKGSALGGVWRYNNDNGHSAAYKSLHINTNKEVMAFSDFPMPASYAMFPHHSEILAYFEAYAAHFELLPLISFSTEVTLVQPQPDGRYAVTLHTGEVRTYEHVLVANGHHWNPRFPEFEGTFSGEVLHAHSYREPEQLEGKDTLIVGIGNSAVDIACEVARTHRGKVVISTRSGAYILPNWIWSMPFDNLANATTAKLPLAIQRLFLKTALWLARGRQADFGVPTPNRPLLTEHPTVSQDLLAVAGRGLVSFKPNIKRLNGHDVMFEDGTTERFDTIIYATGYKVTFPFLKHIPTFDVEESNDLPLYRRVIQPEFPNLYFIGLLQPLGALMPLSEVQAKWIAQLITKRVQLPTKAQMLQQMAADKQVLTRRYKQSARHTMQVDFHLYKQQMERLLAK